MRYTMVESAHVCGQFLSVVGSCQRTKRGFVACIASELRGLLIDRKLGSEALAWLGLPVGVQEAADLHVCTGLSHAVVASRIVISGCIDVLINSSRRERIRSPILGTVLSYGTYGHRKRRPKLPR